MKNTPEVSDGGWVCLRGMPKSTLEGNERGLAVSVRFVLRLKNTNSGFIWRERTGLACRPQADRLQKEPMTAVMSAWLVVRLCNPLPCITLVARFRHSE